MNTQKEIVARWLSDLNRQWGQDCLKLGADNQCHLSTGRYKISFALSANGQEILFWSPIISALKFLENKELLIKLLILNYDEKSLAGTSFSIDRNRRSILLHYRTPVKALDALALGNLLCSFGEIAAGAEKLLAGLAQQEPATRNPNRPIDHLPGWRP